MTWTVLTAHDPALFVGGFLIFLGFARATALSEPDRSEVAAAGRLLSGGLVIHGGLQAWWIAPVLGRLSEMPLFLTATVLTAFNDNALITYLASLVPNLDESLKIAGSRRRRDRRRPDRDRERAEPGWPGAVEPLL